MDFPEKLTKWNELVRAKPRFLVFALVPILLILIVLFWRTRNSHKDVSEIIQGSIIESVYGLATVTSSDVYHLRVAVPSSIRKIFVEEGDQVKEGTPLVEFDSFGTMRSPLDGVVTKVAYETKETVVPQTPVVTVMDLRKRYLIVSLEEKGAVKIQKGQKVRIRFEALGEQNFNGEVRSVYPADGQFQVHITPENIPPQILPGMTADVAIQTSAKENVILVPIKGISSGKINILENGKVNTKEIRTGLVNSEYAELISGEVKLGDKVLLLGDN
ncbi:HlyD family efflux transporter periplasmic adaptor subunit [Leptospira langatensis]|uniref:HlyD family efflux transporter periplasmic adaptor subunit n=1 Tax=Leptospira langatensis TaxID=2484983 RepID=A0A5F1ZRG3_9LEPT|nr:HlyD family efflux transporter periplasmic adaptor subunit [Leptospira langatensis]TGK02719.1 HlyD family efflux transporter periplasmic adaptor subunit [Leptospira langatensis]TGL40077.1 HlyD family efflux transporter periplasmic adaptor subunit [Leptospira langatensis]